MIWDVKLGENFRRKVSFVAEGRTATTPTALTYSYIVSIDLVRIVLTIPELDYLDIMAYEMKEAYLTTKCHVKIYTIAGLDFGSKEGRLIIVKMDLSSCSLGTV